MCSADERLSRRASEEREDEDRDADNHRDDACGQLHGDEGDAADGIRRESDKCAGESREHEVQARARAREAAS